MSTQVQQSPTPADHGLKEALEVFARDLLALVRGNRVYPKEHPYLRDLAGRMVAHARTSLPQPLALGITPSELTLESAFGGGNGARGAELARELHGRKLIRLLWTEEVTPADAMTLGSVLSDRSLSGAALKRALHRSGVYTIDLEPLDLARLHDAFREGGLEDAGDSADRCRKAWHWLLHNEVPTDELAILLVSEQFWADAGTDAADRGDAAALATALVRLGSRLGEALDRLPGEARRMVEERLAGVGRAVAATDLAAILRQADSDGGLHGSGVQALTQHLDGERLVELLAGLVTLEGRGTRRLADVYRRFAPGGGKGELLPLARARLSSPEQGRFAVEVWRTVEEFLLGFEDDPFMEADYTETLESITSAPSPCHGGDEELGLSEDPEGHLDGVFVALTEEAPEPWRARLLDRLEAKEEVLDPLSWVHLLQRVETELPEVVRDRPDFVERAFRRAVGGLRDVGPEGRQSLVEFAVAHESVLLSTVLRALEDEGRISVRRFLVEVVTRFSPEATPTLVARLRSAPWFVTRNLTLAVGRRGDPRVVPVLRSLLGHDHPKVRREAIQALGRIGTESARGILREFLKTGAKKRAERDLVAHVLGESG